MRRKVEFIEKTLDELFPNPPIPLKHEDHFTLLIAVLLSAQCTDKKVNEVTPVLFAVAKTPKEMSLLPLKTLEEIIRPIGLFKTKAKAIKGLSEIILTKHKGSVPASFEELENLPGIGHKTASVIMSQAFKVPAFPVDTHIHRLSIRWGLSKGKTVEETERDLKALFPKESWNKLHLQIIYFARTYCPARNHNTTTCPICSTLISKFLKPSF